jgi:hypothetical protein
MCTRRGILRTLVRLDAPFAGEDHVSMYVILWRFRPAVGREGEFERAYGPSGEWARLFALDDGYLGTELLLRRSDDEWREYLTLETAGPLVLLTKPSEPAGAGSMVDSTVGWKGLPKRRPLWVLSKRSLRKFDR